jgi:tRNA threonylcarbamoyladenosine biosynthesis protein TsaB
MKILGIETATSVCAVGLVDEQNVLAAASEDAGRRHSVVLTGLIDQALSEAGLDKRQIDGVAVSAGPGSFTGLRIGMGLAKGICLAGSIPLALVSTLHALAVESAAPAVSICGALDARHDQLYAGVYKRDGEEWDVSLTDAGRPVDDVIRALSPDTVVAGYGIEPYEDRLLAAGLKVIPSVAPSGSSVALIGEQILLCDGGTSLGEAEPNYCRKSQAERLRAGERA